MVKFSIRKCFCPLCLAGAVAFGSKLQELPHHDQHRPGWGLIEWSHQPDHHRERPGQSPPRSYAVEAGGSATATGTIASTLPAVTAALSGTVVNPGATTSDG